MKCKVYLRAEVLVIDPTGEAIELDAEVYYHEGGRCGARYSHLDVVLPKSSKYAELLQRGYYRSVLRRNELIIDLSRLVAGYKLVVRLKDSVFSKQPTYMTRIYRYDMGNSIKVTVRLPRDVGLAQL